MEPNANQSQEVKNTTQRAKPSKGTTSRRALLRTGLAIGGAGAVATIGGSGLLSARGLAPTLALARDKSGGPSPTQGDIDILRFLAAIETIETDLWQQYNELGGIQDQEVPRGQRQWTVYQSPAKPGCGHVAVYPRQYR